MRKKKDKYSSDYTKYKHIRVKATKKYSAEHPENRMLWAAKRRAKAANIEFTISLEDIIIPKFCPLLGIELTNVCGEGAVISNPSLDRIDNTKGYTKDNVWVISKLANTMKSSATKEQLLAFADSIKRLWGK